MRRGIVASAIVPLQAPLDLEYLGLWSLGGSLANWSLADIPLGTESPEREIIMIIGNASGSGGGELILASLNGLPMSLDARTVGRNIVTIARAAIPNGTLGNLSITTFGSSSNVMVGVYRSASHLFPLRKSEAHATTHTTIQGAAGGVVLGTSQTQTVVPNWNDGLIEDFRSGASWYLTGAHLTTATDDMVDVRATTTALTGAYTAIAASTYVREAGFSPLNLSDLACWLRPDGLPYGDGAPAPTWYGGVRKMIQGNATLQPVVTTTSGVPKALSFDGTKTMTQSSAYSMDRDQTFFAVVRVNIDTTTEKNIAAMSTGTGVYLGVKSMKPVLGCFGGDFAKVEGSPMGLDQWAIVSGVYRRGVSLSVAVNKGPLSTVSTTTLSTPSRNLNLGAANGQSSTGSFIGQMAEYVHTRAAVTESERLAVVDYLSAKHGIGV